MDVSDKQKLDLELTISALVDKVDALTEAHASASEKVVESENRFRSIVMHAPVGITILRSNKLVVEMANNTYLSIIDRTEEQFVGKPLFETLWEVEAAVKPIFDNIFQTGEPYYGYEFEVPLRRGGAFEKTYFNFVYYPLREQNGEIDIIIVVANEVTAQVLAKKALEQREIQFREMVMRSPIAMTIFRGRDLVIEMANEAMLKNLWARSLEEVEGKKLLDVFPELQDQKFPELLRHVMDAAQAHKENEAIAWINTPNGLNKHYLDFEYAPLLDAHGTVSGIIATVYDVTEKVLARQATEFTEKRYRELIDNLPAAIYTIDAEGYVDFYNQEAVRLWGRQPVLGKDKWCGAHQLLELNGTEIPLKDCAMAKALQENKPQHAEVYIVRPDGTKRHVGANPRPIHDNDGNAIGALNIIIDLTDRIEAERALGNSEQKFRMLANSMPQMIWTADPSGTLNYFSQSVFDYSGFTAKRIFEEGWLAIVHPDDRDKNIELWQSAIVTGKDFHYEHRFRRNDGEYRWQLSRAIPQKDLEGNITLWVGTSTDIHDRKVIGDELAKMIEERTEELRLKNDALLKSNTELMQFTYVASHDLQEPLRKIQAFVSRIQDTETESLSDRAKDYFARIEKSSARMQLLIHDLLEFSRTNTFDKHFEITDVNQVLTKVTEDLSELIQEKEATIQWSSLPKMPAITFQITQLFSNLISNSIKFAKPGVAPVITIDCTEVKWTEVPAATSELADKYYHITVADNGIGFKPEYSERIFMLFQRLHGRDAYEGTGIGLAICKKIMDNHHGFIAASSEPESGATFHIYLPAKR